MFPFPLAALAKGLRLVEKKSQPIHSLHNSIDEQVLVRRLIYHSYISFRSTEKLLKKEAFYHQQFFRFWWQHSTNREGQFKPLETWITNNLGWVEKHPKNLNWKGNEALEWAALAGNAAAFAIKNNLNKPICDDTKLIFWILSSTRCQW